MTKESKGGFFVEDRRFWTGEREVAERDDEPSLAAAAPAAPQVDVERLRNALAELEDAKSRVRRDSQRQLELDRARILESLLPVLDNLERSLTAAEVGGQTGALFEGVKLVHNQFLAALGQFGLERRSAVGERFDPRLHDAVAVIPVERTKDGLVVGEVEPAYVVGDRVIRPAKVQVGRAAGRPES